MSAIILYGKDVAEAILSSSAGKAGELIKKGVKPGLGTILAGEDGASRVYVRNKIKACQNNNIESFHIDLPGGISEKDLISKIEAFNKDDNVHGILVQLPLPGHINFENVLMKISPGKDVDGLHPLNQGLLLRHKKISDIEASGILLPCTPAGIIEMLKRNNIRLSGKQAVVVGRSNLVGKPLAMLLLASDATVTMCHSKTRGLEGICRQADILIAAAGAPKIIKSNMVKEGAVVIDVGINRAGGNLTGDVDFEGVKEKAGFITPVPRGVGPVTVAMLISNTVFAAERALLK